MVRLEDVMVNLALVNLDLLPPVVTLCALETMGFPSLLGLRLVAS